MERFEGKVVVVTGAASGIGRATALRVASEGAAVACVDMAKQACDEVVAEIESHGGKALTVECNLLDVDSIPATITAAVDRFGRIDALLNIAGMLLVTDDLTHSLEDWNRLIGVNLTGTFFMSTAALPHLIESNGAIVNTASTAGTKGQPWSSGYSAAKGGVIALTQTMAVSHARSGVRVNCIAPGGVDTPIMNDFTPPEGADLGLIDRIQPLHRMGTPDELAAAYSFLASDEGSYCNGIVLRVDGGQQA
jgi:NAD(P)-dependent dehydrogenase (short-subunit alcohol dehydrogenase family)